MFKKIMIALLLVSFAAVGIFSVANGAGSWSPFQNQDQAAKLVVQSAETSDEYLDFVQESIFLVGGELDDLENPQDDLEDGEEEFNPEEDVYCNGTATSPHPVGTKLAELYLVSYEEIMSWYCLGWGFGEIAIAYTISMDSLTPVADLFAMHESGMGWGEIMMELGYEPGDFPKKLKLAHQEKKWCEVDLESSKIERLAEKLGLTTEEVTAWLCEDSANIGMLQKAASLAAELGVPLDEIIAKRQDGMSWGEIFKEYDKIPANHNQEKKGEPNPSTSNNTQSNPGNSPDNGNKNGSQKNGKSKP